MSMDDLKAVQAAGWTLIATDGDSTLAACPSFGCGVKVRIPHGKRVLSCDPGLNRGPRDMREVATRGALIAVDAQRLAVIEADRATVAAIVAQFAGVA